MDWKFVKVAILCALGIGGILGVLAITRHYDAKPQAAIPVVPAGNKVPDRFWLQDYQALLDLQDEIQKIQKQDGLAVKNDQLRGLASRLQAQVPAGYTFDDATRSFKPVNPPAQGPPPVPSAAAPQPKPAAAGNPNTTILSDKKSAPAKKPMRGTPPPPHAELFKTS